VLLLWCGFSLFAFLWIIIVSLKTNREFFVNVWALFKQPQFGNYLKVLTTYQLGRYFLNSLLVVVISVAGTILISSMAAYVLARVGFRFSRTLTRYFVLLLGVPIQLILVPLYFTMLRAGLVNRLSGIVLIYIALALPFTIFLMMSYFRSLPHELEESALIDGCAPMGTFFRIMLPIAQPAVITAIVFNFVDNWNEFMLVLTFVTDKNKATLALGLYKIQEGMIYTGDWVSLFAGFVLITIPSAIVYIFFSKRVIAGLTLGALKG
jgi:ABC-type glycerol-3-phosphate transport system permease component